MSRYLIAYAAAAGVFLAADALWLGVVAKDPYRAQIGHLLAPQFRIGPAALFYLMYVAGVVYFGWRPQLGSTLMLVTVMLVVLNAFQLLPVLPLDGGLARRAALAGGALGLKLIDAIHYVSAREAGCRHFLTGDGRFKSTPSMTVVGLT